MCSKRTLSETEKKWMFVTPADKLTVIFKWQGH